MGASNRDTVILKANKDFYDNLNQNQRSNFEIMGVNLSGFEYELDELHCEIEKRVKEYGSPYFKAIKERDKRRNELRIIKEKGSK